MEEPKGSVFSTDNYQPVAKIADCIALVECALAEIIETESKGIKRFIAKTGVSKTQLCALNASLSNVIDSVSKLQMVLQSILYL